VSTSVAYLRKRLAAIERYDLLAAVDRGEISHFAAATEAGIAKRYGLIGNGSENQAKKRDWALAKIEREAKRAPEPAHPVTPLVPEIADIIRKLVAANRADLIIQVAEYRLTPFEAEAVVDQLRPTPTPKAEGVVARESDAMRQIGDPAAEDEREKARKGMRKHRRTVRRDSKLQDNPAEPETPKPKWDVRAMIG
jgi:hypothetical protein